MKWPWTKKPAKSVPCFFCKIDVPDGQTFDVQYRAADGVGKVIACPMCAGIINDLMITGKAL